MDVYRLHASLARGEVNGIELIGSRPDQPIDERCGFGRLDAPWGCQRALPAERLASGLFVLFVRNSDK